MNIDENMDELIKEIALKNGIAVGREDPIMVLCTINQKLMRETAEAQNQILKQYKEEIEVLSHRWSEDTKAKAEKIINAALAASRTEIAKGIKDAAKVGSEEIIKGFKISNESVTEQVKMVSKINLLGAAIVFAAALLIVWATKF